MRLPNICAQPLALLQLKGALVVALAVRGVWAKKQCAIGAMRNPLNLEGGLAVATRRRRRRVGDSALGWWAL